MSTLVKKLSKRELLNIWVPPPNFPMEKGIINLFFVDPDIPTPPHIIEAAYKAMKQGYTKYDLSHGLPESLTAITGYFKNYGIQVDPSSEIQVTAGSSQAIRQSLWAFLNPGDQVIIEDPCYPPYLAPIMFAGAEAVRVPLIKERKINSAYRPDVEALAGRITDKTKIILINQSHNPTGCIYTRDELTKISELAIANDLLVISDEVYQGFIWNNQKHESIYTLAGMKERTMLIWSFSKLFSMTGWRLGCIISNPEIINHVNLVPMEPNPPTFIQKAGVAALEGPWESVDEIRETFRNRLDYTVKRLNELDGVFCPYPDSGITLFPDISGTGMSSMEFFEFARKEAKVLVTPGKALVQPGRVTLGFVLSSQRNC